MINKKESNQRALGSSVNTKLDITGSFADDKKVFDFEVKTENKNKSEAEFEEYFRNSNEDIPSLKELKSISSSDKALGLEKQELEDEFNKFILFVQFPFIFVLAMLAFFGTCLEMCIAYPIQQGIEHQYLASSKSLLIKKLIACLSIISIYISVVGIELREYCLQTIFFWSNFWNKKYSLKNDHINLLLELKNAFKHFSNWSKNIIQLS